jgi:hypothetical protein
MSPSLPTAAIGAPMMAMTRIIRKRTEVAKLSDNGFRGYPIATVALYGPTAQRASKVAVAIFLKQSDEPDFLQRWFSPNESADVRHDPDIDSEMVAFIRKHEVRSVVMTNSIIGCPHEEGVDYPEGQKCPQCPFWASRNRFTHDVIQ